MLYRLQQKLQDAYIVSVLVHIHSHMKQLIYHPGIYIVSLLIQVVYNNVTGICKSGNTLSELVSHSGHVDVHYITTYFIWHPAVQWLPAFRSIVNF